MSITDPHADEHLPDDAPRVYVVLVNWNRPRLTEKCLASVFESDYSSYGVILCDNGSTDDSLGTFLRWARRRDGGGEGPGLLSWTLREGDGTVRERGGGTAPEEPPAGTLDIVDIGENLGFAGACNVGMRLAGSRGGCRYFWLLNNDTTIDPRALSELVDEMRRDPGAGFCGSTVLVAGDAERVQALGGGSYDPWLGRTRLFSRDGLLAGDEGCSEADRIRRAMDFVVGTSMLVDARVFEDIGPMSEEYFLYFEELDWVRRSRGRFGLAFAPRSLVYHEVGGTIGSHVEGRARTLLSDYYGIRNRILFTKRHYRWCLPTVYVGLLGTVVVRLARRQGRRAAMILALASWGIGLVSEERLRRKYARDAEG